MDGKKLTQIIDSNNNTEASHMNTNSSSKSSLDSIGKQCASKNNAVSSTSTVSSVSAASFKDLNNNNVRDSADKNAIKRNIKILHEKENKSHHFMTSSEADNKPQFANGLDHASEQNGDNKKPAKYGELVILGYNGCIAQATKPDDILNFHKSGSMYSKRRKSKFILQAKDKPSGVKPSAQFNCHTKQDLNNVISKNTENHSVTYTLSRTHQVIVQYVPDETTDMFQIGRSTETAIDFIVLDTQVPQFSSARGKDENVSLAKTAVIAGDNGGKPSSAGTPGQSTISRYSCRISVERQYPYTARIYAAGFDSSKRIFLGEKATKWKNEKDEFDGVTTNGVLIMHPPEGFLYDSDVSFVNEWMEVSVGGAVFNLDENRLAPCLNKNASSGANQSDPNNRKSNILRDGTLIDLCGATLLWRSIDSLKHTPTKQYLEMNLSHLNQLRPQCPVGFKTLVFPSSASPSSTSHLPSSFLSNNILLNNNSNANDLLGRFKFPYQSRLIKASGTNKHADRIPMVYLKCGHIHGMHDWGVKKDNERECPLCRKVGPYVQLLVGIEPSFYCDTNFQGSDCNNYTPFKPYAFLPCGHMASESTCRYWAQIKIPQGVTQGLSSLCPFCAVPLCKDQPIVKLILQEGL